MSAVFGPGSILSGDRIVATVSRKPNASRVLVDGNGDRRVPAEQAHPMDTSPMSHCAHGSRLNRRCFDCTEHFSN